MCRFVLGSVKTEGGVGLANRYKSLLGDSGNDSPVVVVAVCRRRGEQTAVTISPISFPLMRKLAQSYRCLHHSVPATSSYQVTFPAL